MAGDGGRGEGEGGGGGDSCCSTQRPGLGELLLLLLSLLLPATSRVSGKLMTLPSSLRPITKPFSGLILTGSLRNLMTGAPSGVKPRNLAVISTSSLSLSSARRVCL
jgi:hypothetical protein